MHFRQGGFTLVELAVILVIIAACVTVVFPKFSNGLLERQRFRSSVSKIASTAEYAHQKAISTHLTHLLHINIEQGTYRVTAQTQDGMPVPMADGLNLTGRLPDDVQFAAIEFRDVKGNFEDVVTIEFSPQGWIEPATIYMTCDDGGNMSIVMHEMLGYIETLEEIK